MKSVLIIGGYGGFGARLSRRLSKAGWRVLVAGRRLDQATAFCAELANAEPVQADRTQDLTPLLTQMHPDLVIDAAGPFQGGDYRLPLACIAADIDYLDLADARDFVCDIAQLDAAAKAANVAVISGASSVPALSGAVLAQLTPDFTKVTAIDMAISASNRATAGPSVSAAILSYVGRPVRLWRGGRWVQVPGWSDLREETFAVTGRQTLRRLTALSDVPDQDLLPQRLTDKPATIFRAGPEFRFQVLGIWALSWPVRWGWIKSLSGMANWLRYLQAPTNALGSDRSGMVVEVKGFSGDQALMRRWTLIAEQGDGPEIPTLAAVILASMIADKSLPAGARDAGGALTLEQFAPQFDGLAIYHETTTQPYTPLYQRIMGDAFNTLPAPVQAIHNIIGDGGAIGDATTVRGTSWLARLTCTIMGFPPSGQTPLHVRFEEHKGVERWTRTFGSNDFSSELSQSGAYLSERFGPLKFTFDLSAQDNCLGMHLRNWTAFSLPMPKWLALKSTAKEWADGDTFCFSVTIDLPIIGRVVDYNGRLKPA